MMTRADVTTYHTVGADNHQLDLYKYEYVRAKRSEKKRQSSCMHNFDMSMAASGIHGQRKIKRVKTGNKSFCFQNG